MQHGAVWRVARRRAQRSRRGATLDASSDAVSAEPVNRSYLARFTLGNAALEREVLELFAAQAPALSCSSCAPPTRPKAWQERRTP